MSQEQTRSEKQVSDFEEGVWGHVTDSTQVDSAEVLSKKAAKKAAKEAVKITGSTSRRRAAASAKRESSEKSSNSSNAPRVSARRQRR